VTEQPKLPDEPSIHCRRLERRLPLHEHATCPYCFGDVQEICTAEHQRFCDYQPGKDPIQFGFPPDSSRHQQG